MIPERKHVCIMQNVELGSHISLSVFLTDLLKNFKTNIHRIDLVVANFDKTLEKIISKVASIRKTNTSLYSVAGNFLYVIRGFKQLRIVHKEEPINVIHCIRPNSSLAAAVLFKVFVSPSVKLIYDVRSPWIEMIFERGHISFSHFNKILLNFLYLQERLLSLFVAQFVFITDGLRNYYQQKIHNKTKYIIVPSGVDVDFFKKNTDDVRKEKGFKDSDIVLGVMSSLVKVRNLEFVIESFAKLREVSDKYKLYFIGAGPDERYYREIVKNKGLSESVYFEGKVPHLEIPKYLHSVDIGISHIPNLFVYRQSFPLKILEYLSSSLPVVASRIDAHVEIASRLHCISVYDFNPESFVRTVEKVTKEKKVNPENNDILHREYDWKSLSQKYLDVYNSI